MAKDCNNQCESCFENCVERVSDPIGLETLNELSSVKKVIAIVSGKGGVGKSLVTSLLATTVNKMGYTTAILDADITGPSIPKAFGIKEKAFGSEEGIYPTVSMGGISIMSTNLLLDNDTDPVVWRGPIIATMVKQFWKDVIWTDIEYMFIDMPPGTGDVPLTIYQSIPIDGIIVVTTPQDLVSMIVTKAINMARMMNVPILGIVENMSYFKCDNCEKEHFIFGSSKIEEFANEQGLSLTTKIPLDPKITSLFDQGQAERVDSSFLEEFTEKLINILG